MSDVDIPVLGVDALVQPMLILITGSNTHSILAALAIIVLLTDTF